MKIGDIDVTKPKDVFGMPVCEALFTIVRFMEVTNGTTETLGEARCLVAQSAASRTDGRASYYIKQNKKTFRKSLSDAGEAGSYRLNQWWLRLG